jgi:SAM-dependent methyltransferase
LVVLDNIYEHLPDHALALDRISRALRPGGVLYLLAPNRVWPLEVHYGVPFLSWPPLPIANQYLRWTGRGTDYSDACYAPTYRGFAKEMRDHPELVWQCVLPGDPTATKAGAPVHYRTGMWLLRRYPWMWSISEALLVVAVKEPRV